MFDLQDVLDGRSVPHTIPQHHPYILPFLSYLKEAYYEVRRLDVLEPELLDIVNELRKHKMTQKIKDPAKSQEDWNRFINEHTRAAKEKERLIKHAKHEFQTKATKAVEKADEGIAGLEQKLLEWQDNQRWSQIGPQWCQRSLIESLDPLDCLFEEFEKGLKFLHESFQRVPSDTQKISEKIQSQVQKLVIMSCIIAKMPPLLLKKAARVPKNTERPKKLTVTPDCTPVIRVLGGKCLGVRVQQFSKTDRLVECCIVVEAEAKRIMNENISAITNAKSIGKLTNSTAKFEEVRGGHYVAAFKHMALTDLENRAPGGARDRREDEAIRQRYYIIFFVPFSFYWMKSEIKMTKTLHSLPSAVVVGTKQKTADAYITWDLAFANGCSLESIENVPRENSDGIAWHLAFKALDLKFQQLIEGAHPDIPLSPENSLSHVGSTLDVYDTPSHHLAEKLFFSDVPPERYEECRMRWEQFFEISSESYQPGDPRKPAEDKDGNLCSFMDWFWKCADLVHRYLYPQWKKNLIAGFMGKVSAERLVANNKHKSMILRFSDSQMSSLMITFRTHESSPKHLLVSPENLDNTNISTCVYQIPSLSPVELIYPDIPKRYLDESDGAQPSQSPGGSSTVYFQRLTTTLLEVGETWVPPLPPANAMISCEDWMATASSFPDLPQFSPDELDVFLGSENGSQFTSPSPHMDMET